MDKRRILVLDDHAKTRKTLSDILRTKGYTPISAATGKEALDRVKEGGPAVALIDLRLEDTSGLDVMREIKESSPGTECIVLTGYASRASAIEAVDLGAYSYLRKPLDMEHLLLTVHRAFDKREAAEALRESEERFRNIYEQSPIGIELYDSDGQLLHVNKACLEIFGISDVEEVKAFKLFEDPNVTDEVKERLLEGELVRYETLFDFEKVKQLKLYDTSKSGIIYLDVVMTPLGLNTKGHVDGYLLQVQDITERKRAEEALEEYSEGLEQMVEDRTKELRDAQEELIRREKLAVLGQLASGVGHELRNPLGAIKNAAYFLNMVLEEPEPEVRETLEIMEKEVGVSEKIISSLLAFARPKPPSRRKVNLNDVVREALSRVTVPENVEVTSRLDEALPDMLADPDQLAQVFGNIILNAIQAMPEGGRLVVKSETMGAEWVAVSFADTGMGIPEEDLERIFEPLFTTKAKGIGFGLALTETLVKGDGGAIGVRSEVGKGSTFTVRLPTGELGGGGAEGRG